MDELEIKKALDRLSELQSALDALGLQKQALIDQVITPEVRAQLAEIDAEFAPMIEAATAQANELEVQIKIAVIAAGASVKGTYLQAVYSKPRVTWDSKQLDGMMALIPGLAAARKEGAPSVSLRRV